MAVIMPVVVGMIVTMIVIMAVTAPGVFAAEEGGDLHGAVRG